MFILHEFAMLQNKATRTISGAELQANSLLELKLK